MIVQISILTKDNTIRIEDSEMELQSIETFELKILPLNKKGSEKIKESALVKY